MTVAKVSGALGETKASATNDFLDMKASYQVMKFNNPELMNWMKEGIGE